MMQLHTQGGLAFISYSPYVVELSFPYSQAIPNATQTVRKFVPSPISFYSSAHRNPLSDRSLKWSGFHRCPALSTVSRWSSFHGVWTSSRRYSSRSGDVRGSAPSNRDDDGGGSSLLCSTMQKEGNTSGCDTDTSDTDEANTVSERSDSMDKESWNGVEKGRVDHDDNQQAETLKGSSSSSAWLYPGGPIHRIVKPNSGVDENAERDPYTIEVTTFHYFGSLPIPKEVEPNSDWTNRENVTSDSYSDIAFSEDQLNRLKRAVPQIEFLDQKLKRVNLQSFPDDQTPGDRKRWAMRHCHPSLLHNSVSYAPSKLYPWSFIYAMISCSSLIEFFERFPSTKPRCFADFVGQVIILVMFLAGLGLGTFSLSCLTVHNLTKGATKDILVPSLGLTLSRAFLFTNLFMLFVIPLLLLSFELVCLYFRKRSHQPCRFRSDIVRRRLFSYIGALLQYPISALLIAAEASRDFTLPRNQGLRAFGFPWYGYFLMAISSMVLAATLRVWKDLGGELELFSGYSSSARILRRWEAVAMSLLLFSISVYLSCGILGCVVTYRYVAGPFVMETTGERVVSFILRSLGQTFLEWRNLLYPRLSTVFPYLVDRGAMSFFGWFVYAIYWLHLWAYVAGPMRRGRRFSQRQYKPQEGGSVFPPTSKLVTLLETHGLLTCPGERDRDSTEDDEDDRRLDETMGPIRRRSPHSMRPLGRLSEYRRHVYMHQQVTWRKLREPELPILEMLEKMRREVSEEQWMKFVGRNAMYRKEGVSNPKRLLLRWALKDPFERKFQSQKRQGQKVAKGWGGGMYGSEPYQEYDSNPLFGNLKRREASASASASASANASASVSAGTGAGGVHADACVYSTGQVSDDIEQGLVEPTVTRSPTDPSSSSNVTDSATNPDPSSSYYTYILSVPEASTDDTGHGPFDSGSGSVSVMEYRSDSTGRPLCDHGSGSDTGNITGEDPTLSSDQREQLEKFRADFMKKLANDEIEESNCTTFFRYSSLNNNNNINNMENNRGNDERGNLKGDLISSDEEDLVQK